MDSLPHEISDMMNDMMLARIYNEVVGASVSHREVAEWGVKEREMVMAVIELM